MTTSPTPDQSSICRSAVSWTARTVQSSCWMAMPSPLAGTSAARPAGGAGPTSSYAPGAEGSGVMRMPSTSCVVP